MSCKISAEFQKVYEAEALLKQKDSQLLRDLKHTFFFEEKFPRKYGFEIGSFSRNSREIFLENSKFLETENLAKKLNRRGAKGANQCWEGEACYG